MINMKDRLRRCLPAVVAVVVFATIGALYFAPQLKGDVLPQHDVQQYEGMSKDINDMRDTTGEDPQWTGGMFGGMPAYLINVAYPAQIVKRTFGQVIKLVATPIGFVFFAMLAMWAMCLMMGMSAWVGLITALSYGLSTYLFLIIGAGHITKLWAMVYAPLMFGAMFWTMRRNMWVGAALTALCTSLEIGANHPQITYYFLMAMAAFWLSELYFALKAHTLKDFSRRTALLVAAGLLAVGSNFSPLWYTSQHTKETMRGGSELVSTTETSASGLALDYATAWSYGKAESFNLLIPDFMGGESASTFSADGAVATALQKYGIGSAAQQLPTYWGSQPYTAGPTYLGAVAIFLAILGLFLACGRNKWWIIAVSVVMLFLAWGSNMMWFTELCFKYLPWYNKFRTVSMTLTVVEWTVPLLGALALSRLWSDEIDRQRITRSIAWAAGITGGLCLLFAVAGSSLFDFGRTASAEMMTEQFKYMLQSAGMNDLVAQGAHTQMASETANAMAIERADIMSGDAIRSLLFIVAAAITLLVFAWGKIRRGAMIAILGVLIVADMVPVNLRFLPQSKFVSESRQRILPTEADKAIMRDTTLGYRVLNLSVSPFNDATTSYFHRSVGGYHGAKMARYQDLIDRYLVRQDTSVLDMLNTRYTIRPTSEGLAVEVRESANGAAWFVGNIVSAKSAEEEISALGTINTKQTAVVNDEYKVTGAFGTGEIALTEYRPNFLRYEYNADAPATVVFSEIYYNKGWKAYIDGAEAPYFRADYVLRAMELPAGKHTVEWRFRAPSWSAVEGITLLSSIIILLGIIAILIYEGRQKIKA